MAVPFRDKRETYYFRETLSSLVRGLTGKFTVIDLRNEAAVYGRITRASAFMDVELERCIFKNPRGECFPFETFYVRSRNIRYVHIPDGYTSQQLIELGMKSDKPQQAPRGRGKAIFKKKRAQNYQTEILHELHFKHKSA